MNQEETKYLNIAHMYGYVNMVTEILFHFWFPRPTMNAAETQHIMTNLFCNYDVTMQL